MHVDLVTERRSHILSSRPHTFAPLLIGSLEVLAAETTAQQSTLRSLGPAKFAQNCSSPMPAHKYTHFKATKCALHTELPNPIAARYNEIIIQKGRTALSARRSLNWPIRLGSYRARLSGCTRPRAPCNCNQPPIYLSVAY